MADEFTFDASSLKTLGRDLRGAARTMRTETDRTLWDVGLKLTEAAKAIASQNSSTVAGTIKMRAVPGAVRISGGSEEVPIAALWELGNKKSKASATTFRHPVFASKDQGRGDWTWVDQPKHPFLRPALALDRRAITKRMEETWNRALEPHRLRAD